jgi:hypothetical protein
VLFAPSSVDPSGEKKGKKLVFHVVTRVYLPLISAMRQGYLFLNHLGDSSARRGIPFALISFAVDLGLRASGPPVFRVSEISKLCA